MTGIPASLYLFDTCHLGIIATSWIGDAFPAVLLPA